MRLARPLRLTLPAFLLGAFATACLTTSARAQFDTDGEVRPYAFASHWEYKIVSTGFDLDRAGADGWEYCGESATTDVNGNVGRSYTMRRRK